MPTVGLKKFCLSVNIDEGVWHCHHCGWKGTLKEKVKDLTIPVKKPKPPKTELPEEVYKWFEDRCITRAVVDAEKIGYDKKLYSHGADLYKYTLNHYKNRKILNELIIFKIFL